MGLFHSKRNTLELVLAEIHCKFRNHNSNAALFDFNIIKRGANPQAPLSVVISAVFSAIVYCLYLLERWVSANGTRLTLKLWVLVQSFILTWAIACHLHRKSSPIYPVNVYAFMTLAVVNSIVVIALGATEYDELDALSLFLVLTFVRAFG